MKKFITFGTLLVCMILLFVTCKKDSQTKPAMVYDLTGTWTLAEFKSDYGDTVDATVAQYPCMSEAENIYLSDGKLISTFTGKSVCYVTPQGSTETSVGEVGGIPDTGQWKLSGNIVVIKFPAALKPYYGVLNVVNGKLQVTIKDTLIYPPYTYYQSFVDIKQ